MAIAWRVLFVVLLVTSTHEAITGYIENRAFKTRGRVAETDQIYKYEQTVHTKKKRGVVENVSVSNEATISFMAEGNKKISVNKKLPKDVLEKYQKYESVNIEYLSDEPGTTRWRGEKNDVRSSVMFSLFMLVVVIISIKTWKRADD